MTAPRDLDDLKSSNVFDSRDVIERLQYLEIEPDEDEAAELAILQEFADEAEGYAADWHYGETFIRDSYFTEYAQELAEDIGAIDREYSWPASHIDWTAAAEALQQDYSAIELDGVTFWTR
jgi:antirestriction protein